MQGTIERIRDIRAQILVELYGARPLSVTVTGLRRRLARAQFDFSPDEVQREISFLVGQGFAARKASGATGEGLYTITSAGILEHEKSL